jgi:iron complex outermembrane receptor protein
MRAFYPFLFLLTIHFSLLAQTDTSSTDTTKTHEVKDVVISASKQEENLLQTPVSIEKLSLKDIRQSGQPSFFDAIENIKGIQMITPSMGFRVINARGFTNTTNVRFVQMVDGMDNQAPHIGAPIANSLGPNDLDIYRVEVIPGSASAMYGMNAINGAANFITKDPFLFPGLSVQQKTGMNHVNDSETSSPTAFSETSLRFAQAYKKKFAFKLNGTFMKGTDWYADNRTDLNPNANASTQLFGEDNPGKDLVNNYGDEAASNSQKLKLQGKQYTVSRTGYYEKEVTDYGIQNSKGDLTLYYRPTEKVEISYVYRVAYLNTTYQRTNRFRLEDYLTQQHGITLKTPSIQFKTYLTSENTGTSYNIRSMAENIDRSFKSDKLWGTDFSNQFNKDVAANMSVAAAMADARVVADNGRPQPGTPQFSQLIGDLRNVNNWDYGAALRVRTHMYHAEGQHDITQVLLPTLREKYRLHLMYGADFRNYNIIPDGNYFINPTSPGQDINYWKTGGFIQATKYFLSDKVKVNAVLRVDKNQYYDPKFNPRLAIVYSPVQEHNFRASFQNGYRFPSIFEAFSNINSGGVKRVGGLPIMSNGIFENSYLANSVTAFQNAVTTDINTKGMSQSDAIAKNQGLLKKNPYTYLQPEQVTSLEGGYRTSLLQGKLYIDLDAYYNIYHNLIAQVNANVPKTDNPDSVATYLYDKSKQTPYRLWTNSKTVSYNYGGTFGITYQWVKGFKASGNVTYAKLDRKDQQDGLEDGFNTPEWMYNVSIGNTNLIKSLGFSINYRWQKDFLWQSALATGQVSAYSTVDAQVNYGLLKNKVNLKFGATNLFNHYYYSYLGGPSMGGFYYLTVTYEVF